MDRPSILLHGADTAGGTRPARPGGAWEAFAAASERLLEKRRSQRGSYTFGDSWDDAFVQALAALPPAGDPAAVGRLDAVGERLGRDVLARRMFEDSYAGAFVTLSASLMASGLGTLEVAEIFHRTARFSHRPGPACAGADPACIDALLGGIMRGFMGEAFNCAARVERLAPREFALTLGEGRDVNRRRSA